MIKKGLASLAIFFLYLISLLPFPVLYAFSDIIYIVVYHIIGYRRKVVAGNLRNSFPEKTLAELKAIEKKYYRYLGDLMVETIKMLSISRKEVARRMKPTNAEILEKVFGEGRSIIGAVGHYGNWELAALGLSVLTEKIRLVIYKPLTNAEANSIFKKMRSRFGATLVPMKGILRKLVALRYEPTISVFVSDQTPVREEAHYFTEFLNQPTAMFLGVEKLAVMLNSVVMFCEVKVVKRGYYSCTFAPLFNDPQKTGTYEITNAHVRHLENMIKEEPQYWLWSHRRWKFKPKHS